MSYFYRQAVAQRLRNPFQPPRRVVRARGYSGVGRRARITAARRAQLPRAVQELKFHDLDLDDQVVAMGSQVEVTSLNVIAQGTTESQRIGRRVVIKQIHYRYNISLPATATAADTSDVIRIMIVIDKQCNGAAADDLDILESADYQSFNNLSNKKRFTVLFDRTYAVKCHAGAGNGTNDGFVNDMQAYEWHKDCNIVIEYDNSATTGVITSQRSNNLLWLTASRVGKGGTNGKVRLRFHD